MGLAIVVDAELGIEVAGSDPGFRRIEARFRRGAYRQLAISHLEKRTHDRRSTQGSDSNACSSRQDRLFSGSPGFTWPTFDADASPRIDVGGISPPVLSAEDLFCRGA